MSILKFKNIDSDITVFNSAVPVLASYINTKNVYTVYQPFNYDDAMIFVLNTTNQTCIKCDFANDNIGSIEDSNKLTNATFKAMTSNPGGNGVIDVLSLQEFKDLGVDSISWSELTYTPPL
tara:strand:+ start:687 stop:1049 length:363 start_codon:yes stop_codon:yes gene_type:complete